MVQEKKRWFGWNYRRVECSETSGPSRKSSAGEAPAVAVPVSVPVLGSVGLLLLRGLTMKSDMMSVQQYSLSGSKKDILREVVMKYIDHFYPK